MTPALLTVQTAAQGTSPAAAAPAAEGTPTAPAAAGATTGGAASAAPPSSGPNAQPLDMFAPLVRARQHALCMYYLKRVGCMLGPRPDHLHACTVSIVSNLITSHDLTVVHVGLTDVAGTACGWVG